VGGTGGEDTEREEVFEEGPHEARLGGGGERPEGRVDVHLHQRYSPARTDDEVACKELEVRRALACQRRGACRACRGGGGAQARGEERAECVGEVMNERHDLLV